MSLDKLFEFLCKPIQNFYNDFNYLSEELCNALGTNSKIYYIKRFLFVEADPMNVNRRKIDKNIIKNELNNINAAN